MDQTQAASDDPEQSTAPGDHTGAPALPADAVSQFGVNGLIGDGRYKLTRRLGRGGMAEVYAAEDVRLGRTVAVKLMRGDLAEDPIAKARFTREAQSVAGLNHHAIVAVYDSGEDRFGSDTVPYIVMELCEGRTIRELLIDEDAPTVEKALAIVSGVLEALAYSHQHGIVHRDIKPANAVITHGGAVKVMDFGIARALHGASTTMTQTGMVMGTPQYLSPEQALGKAVDHRSDLYATGCLLYELLVLRPPFTGETPLSVVYQHVQDSPRIPSTVNDRVPPELDGLVLRALAKNPDDRFQSAEEMLGVIQYGLRMLTDSGGWTGLWDTGYVDHTAATTALPGPAATTVMPGQSGNTAELGPPLIMGPPIGPAEPGYGYGEDAPPAHHGRNVFLLLVAAVLAVGLGVLLALHETQNTGGTPGKKQSPSATSSGTPSVVPTQAGKPSSDVSTSAPSSPWTDQPTTPYSTWSTDPSASVSAPQPSASASASTPSASSPVTSPSDTSGTGSGGTGSGGTDSGGTGSGGTSGGSTSGTSGTSSGGLTPVTAGGTG